MSRAPGKAQLEKPRCPWVRSESALSLAYHDHEWGIPNHDDRMHFEMLTLEGAQAGLSWDTILNKREGYREAFAGFDAERVARFTERDVTRLMGNPAIVRNELKIRSAIGNARAFLAVQEELGSFDALLWPFVGGKPLVQHPTRPPAKTPASDALSKALLKRGFRFVGSTICYAFMQAVGMVDDHMPGCFRVETPGRRKNDRAR